MGSRGPKKEPVRISEMKDSWRAKARKKEPKFNSGIPECPSCLDDTAKKEWMRIISILRSAGKSFINESDMAALSSYCQAWSQFVKANQELKKCPLIQYNAYGNPMKNPLISIINDARTAILRFSHEYGLTPSARAGITITNDDKNTNLDDMLDQTG